MRGLEALLTQGLEEGAEKLGSKVGSIAQGLKPRHFIAVIGTSKLVP